MPNNNHLSDEDILFFSPISTFKILILCLGNTCRSAFYHNILSNELLKLNKPNIEVFSAGVKAEDNNNISPEVVKILNSYNIPIVKDKTSSLKQYSNIYFDKIIILDENISEDILPKHKLLEKDFMADPFGGTFKNYLNTFFSIEDKVKKNIANLNSFLS